MTEPKLKTADGGEIALSRVARVWDMGGGKLFAYVPDREASGLFEYVELKASTIEEYEAEVGNLNLLRKARAGDRLK